jgi:hypothetical protein
MAVDEREEEVCGVFITTLLLMCAVVIIVADARGLDGRAEGLRTRVAKLETQILAVSAIIQTETSRGGWRWCVKKACISYGV